MGARSTAIAKAPSYEVLRGSGRSGQLDWSVLEPRWPHAWVACIVAVACAGGCGRVSQPGDEPGANAMAGTTLDTPTEFRATACLPRVLPVDHGEASCSVLVANLSPNAPCECAVPGLTPAKVATRAAVRGQLNFWGYCDTVGASDCSDRCVCEVLQMTEDAALLCRSEPTSPGLAGWCYVAPNQQLGDWSEVSDCAPDQKQALRVLGIQQDVDHVLMLACEKP